ncbi:MAG: beta galactosidase jelly roll domain-containing protein, partial [Clostridia bacterium]|nr:beta galactosidase jelly roll domain-containing protein [Clostridia bacterium]
MNKNYYLLLNGDWFMQYLGKEGYDSETEPEEKEGYVIKNAIPGYWEDMLDKFRAVPIHTELFYNPNYTLQRYPQTGYVPDMVLPNVIGSFMYKRNFNVDKSKIEGDIELYVGGVQNTLSVWLNGKFIGRHEGYSSDFSFALSKELLSDGENSITLVVSNPYHKGYKGRLVSGLTNRAANECTGGVYGDVAICIYPDGLKGVHVSTAKDLTTFTVQSVGALNKEKTVLIKDGESVIYEKVIPNGESEITLSIQDMEFWSPSNPKLYTVILSTKNQHVTQKFGIRRLSRSADGKHLILNGKPFFFRGVCEHTYFAKTVHPVKDTKYYSAVIKKLKSLGFNSLRFHTNVPMAEYMQSADELGMFIEVETPNNTSVEEWRDIVRYTRDYTSVVMYSSGNEMIIDEDYIEHLREC